MSYTVMAAKTIALDLEAYALLRSHKRGGESFSDVVKRELRPRRSILDLAGSLKDLPESAWEDFEVSHRAQKRLDLRQQRKLEGPG